MKHTANAVLLIVQRSLLYSIVAHVHSMCLQGCHHLLVHNQPQTDSQQAEGVAEFSAA